MTEISIVSCVNRRGVDVLSGSGEERVHVPGRLLRGWKPAVGDLVDLEEDIHGRAITAVHPRRNALERSSPSGGTQVIAANIDLALIFTSLRDPAFRRGFMDRAAASCEWHSIEACLAVNKTDLAAPGDGDLLALLERDCGRAGMRFAALSCATGAGVPELTALVAGRTVLLTGQSGSGKTTFTSLLGSRSDLRIGAVNLKTGKGRHTTVAARAVPAAGGTVLFDTPGLRVFPIDHIPRFRLQDCFREMRQFSGDCRFRDCLHAGEPGCGVQNAVDAGWISRERYSSYLELLEELPGG